MASRTDTTPGTAPAVNLDTRPLTGRRNILGDAIAGLAGAVILAGAGVAMATPETLASEPNPDAELISLCDRSIAAWEAYNLEDSDLDDEDNPLWHLAEDIEAQIERTETRTFAGVAAIARVALFWSTNLDGSENFDTSFTGDWPERVVRDFLRLHGGGLA